MTDFSKIASTSSRFWESRILHTAVELKLFDAIGGKTLSARDIASSLSTEPRATEILLNALVAMGLLNKDGSGFSNTPSSAKYLLTHSPEYYGEMILFDASLWGVWENLPESVRTGKPAKEPDMFQRSPEETERFIMAMHSLVNSRGDAELVAPMLGLEGVNSMLDVGSGPGTYPVAFLRKHPHLNITIFDLPATLEVTRKVLKKEGLCGRIKLYEGDYNNTPLPRGFDLVLMSNIIHSEREEENRSLIEKAYEALNPGGRIVIKDHVLNESLTSPTAGALFSVLMLLITKGRDYSFEELKSWLDRANFKDAELIPLPAPMNSSLVIGTK